MGCGSLRYERFLLCGFFELGGGKTVTQTYHGSKYPSQGFGHLARLQQEEEAEQCEGCTQDKNDPGLIESCGDCTWEGRGREIRKLGAWGGTELYNPVATAENDEGRA